MNYTCSKNIEIMEIDQEWIIMDTENFTVTKLNNLGATILSDLKGGKEVHKIIESIVTDYSADAKVVEADVLAYLEELKKIGIITDEEPTNANI